MESIGTWRDEYADAVRICAGLMEQYDELNGMYVAEGLPYFERTGDGGSKKSAIVSTLENLRRDILAYLKELGLTPGALKKLDIAADRTQSTVLAAALRKLGC